MPSTAVSSASTSAPGSDAPLTHDRRVLLLTVVAGIPAVVAAMILLWTGDFASRTQWTVSVIVVGAWMWGAFAVREEVIRPLQAVANLLAALREEDYSIRARGAHPDEVLGLALFEINELAGVLRERRLGSIEAGALLGRVIAEIDAAIFAFDDAQRLQLVNRAGAELLAQPPQRLVGRHADALGLAACLEDEGPRLMDLTFPGKRGRWEVRRSTFRQGGLPHRLLVLSDVGDVLREEERQAWQRIIRVLGHEINNSLAPIKSIAESLGQALERPGSTGWEEDVRSGLGVIAARSESLRRFMASYARLARLPRPKRAPVQVAGLVHRVAGLETRCPVRVTPGPDSTLLADADQLEQLLINVVSNAVDAVAETAGGVTIGWETEGRQLAVWVDDEGPGLPDPTNLFVPFFTTKPSGSGIGLVLSRQIAEAHGGTLSLENRAQGGCRATLRLPLERTARRG